MGGSSAYSYKTSLVLDAENNLYVTDYFNGTINLQDTLLIANENMDFYLSKYDPNGSLLWVKQYFNVFNIQSHSLCIDSNNNLFITGSYRGEVSYQNNVLLSPYGYDDIFVSKFDENGDFIWIISAGGTMSERGKDIICYNNNVYISGSFVDVVTFGDITIISYDNVDYLRDAYFAKIKDHTVQVNKVDNDLILSVMPNPSNGHFSLKAKGVNKQGYFEISNIRGQILLKRELNDIVERVNISNYPSGVYFISIRTENFTKTEKIIKR